MSVDSTCQKLYRQGSRLLAVEVKIASGDDPPPGGPVLNVHTAAPAQHPAIRPEWLALHREAALEPSLPLIDAHHHLWGAPRVPYLLDDYLADVASGHNVRASVFIECGTHYRAGGDPLLRPLGEMEFVAAAASRAAARGSGPRVAQGIVGHADLSAGAAWHPNPAARGSIAAPPPMLMMEPDFRAGFAELASLGLRFDAWAYHTQLAELRDLADDFPHVPIVLNHVGGAIGIGPYAARRGQVEAAWKDALRGLSHCANIHLKLGGLGMRLFGFGFHEQVAPPGSVQLAEAWRPWIETAVEIFGPARCMFESNFPVDKASCGYTELWNAFKRVTMAWAPDERAALFHDNAARFYGLSRD